MSAWAIAGQSLSYLVGGVGIGLAIAFGGQLWTERHRAGDLTDQLLAQSLALYQTAAELSTCQAVEASLREGAEIDLSIPTDLDGFVVPDTWRLRPVPAPDG